jgi:hypothetical protein
MQPGVWKMINGVGVMCKVIREGVRNSDDINYETVQVMSAWNRVWQLSGTQSRRFGWRLMVTTVTECLM